MGQKVTDNQLKHCQTVVSIFGESMSARASYSSSLVSQGAHRFYSLTMPSEVLATSCFVDTRRDDAEEGFQRVLDKKRAQEIADYIDLGFGTIPSSIVLSAQADAQMVYDKKKRTLSFNEVPKAFLVLDGQHRVYGFRLAKTKLRIPVVIYNNLSRAQESKLFIDINTKQRPVPNELLLDIKGLAEYENDQEAFLRGLFDFFQKESASALNGLMSPSERIKGKISRVTFNRAFKPHMEILQGKPVDEVYGIVNSYLSAIYKGLTQLKVKETISNPIVFCSIVNLFTDVSRICKDRFDSNYTEENFRKVLQGFFSRIRASDFKNPGASVRRLSDSFQKALKTTHTL